jgi:hypothetical protein
MVFMSNIYNYGLVKDNDRKEYKMNLIQTYLQRLW